MNKFTGSFGLIGVICILFGVVSLILTGLRGPFFYGELAAGLGLVIAYIALHSGSFLSGLKGRKTRAGTHEVLYSAIALTILLFLNFLSYRHFWKLDLTEEKVHSLAEQSVKVAKEMKTAVAITAFFRDSNPNVEAVRRLLETYREKGGKLSYTFVDPDRDPQLAKEYGAKDGTVLFKAGLQNHLVTEPSEENFTNALIKVAKADKPVLYALLSHSCRSAANEKGDGLSDLKKGIENEGYLYKDLPQLNQGVPADGNLLLISGPKTPFTPAETAKLEEFVERGGNLLLLLDPILADVRFSRKFEVLATGLEGFLEKRGVKLNRDLILESHLQPFFGVTTGLAVLTAEYGVSPITESLKDKATSFNEVRSLERIYNNTFEGTVSELVKSAGNGASWAERNVDQLIRAKKASVDKDDLPGPVTLAMSVERQASPPAAADKAEAAKKGYRLVVAGNGDFATNDNLVRYPYNGDLFLNALNWLAGKQEQIAIRPKKIRPSSLALDVRQSNIILYVAVLGIPQLILILGLLLWQRRKSR